MNFVDPLGLDKDPPVLLPPGTKRPFDPNFELPIRGSERSGSFGGLEIGSMEIETATDGPTGAEPDPRDTVQADPDSNCLTINKLLQDERVREAFDKTWRATTRSGNENGGWLIADENYPEDVCLYTASEGEPNHMPNEPEEFSALLKEDANQQTA